MYGNNRNGSGAPSARGFAAFFAIILAMRFSLAAFPVEAAPFAYVTNGGSSTVSVIDTATNMVVATVPVGAIPSAAAVTPDGKHAYVANASIGSTSVSVIDTATNVAVATVPFGMQPFGVAVTPDGKHAYVALNAFAGTVSVIDTVTNTVVGTPIPVGNVPDGVAVTPDGKHVYVTNFNGGNVSVIDTSTNTVGTTILVGNGPVGVAFSPDGKHAYVANDNSDNVSVIDTATNMVVATVAVRSSPDAVAVTPDGIHAYVTNNGSNNVSVIDTASNTVVATVPVGNGPHGVAVTPDGKHAYVTNNASTNVSVIATATNKVVTTVPVGNNPVDVAIVPPPPGLPFRAFSATQLQIGFGAAPNTDFFNLHSIFTLSSTTNKGINPLTDPVTFQVGTFTTTIPPGSFTNAGNGSFTFTGVIGGVSLQATITELVTLRFGFNAIATGASLTGTKNSVYVTLTIGGDSGATSVTAQSQGHASPL